MPYATSKEFVERYMMREYARQAAETGEENIFGNDVPAAPRNEPVQLLPQIAHVDEDWELAGQVHQPAARRALLAIGDNDVVNEHPEDEVVDAPPEAEVKVEPKTEDESESDGDDDGRDVSLPPSDGDLSEEEAELTKKLKLLRELDAAGKFSSYEEYAAYGFGTDSSTPPPKAEDENDDDTGDDDSDSNEEYVDCVDLTGDSDEGAVGGQAN